MNPSNKTGKIPLPPKQSFFSRNIVAIVMIPSIIGIHYGWSLMQDNRTLVSESEKIDLPLVTFAKYCWNRVTGSEHDKKIPSVSAAK